MAVIKYKNGSSWSNWVVPIESGGTGADTMEQAQINLNYFATANFFSSYDITGGKVNDTQQFWLSKPSGLYYFSQTDMINNQPTQYCLLSNMKRGNVVFQMVISAARCGTRMASTAGAMPNFNYMLFGSTTGNINPRYCIGTQAVNNMEWNKNYNTTVTFPLTFERAPQVVITPVTTFADNAGGRQLINSLCYSITAVTTTTFNLETCLYNASSTPSATYSVGFRYIAISN